jgi:L-alanine-DL-glutamate epimerase-like enolase superfamily enzyme
LKLSIHHFALPLRHTFRISREAIATQPTVIVELESHGQHGFGEATTNSYYGVTSESLARSVESVRGIVESWSDTDPKGLWEALRKPLADHPFALCALDEAAHDLAGKRAGKRCYQLWGLPEGDRPASNFTIGIDDVDVMIAKLKEMPGWPVYKIKLGTEHDLEIIRRLREHTDAVFRVDANCAWSADQTLRNAEVLAGLGVEFIEQPLPAHEWQAQQYVYRRSCLPIMADESCQVEADVPCCLGFFHGVNIKLVKCGGLTPALRMIEEARRLGLRVMVGCMTESTVGISAIAQLLPLLDYVDMDGACLLAKDIASGVRVDRGICHYSHESGTGAGLLAAD